MTKRTRKENFEDLIVLAEKEGRQDLVDFVNHQIEMDNKKKESKGETAKQKENEKDFEQMMFDIENENNV